MAPLMSKILSETDIDDKFSMPTKTLGRLPLFPQGQNFQDLYVEDEQGKEWCFRLIIRRGRHRKPVLSAGWRRFVREKGLRRGFKVEIFKKTDEVTGGFKFKIIVKRPVAIFGIVIGYTLHRVG